MVPEGKNHLGPVPPTLTFAHVPEGKTVKNRLHLDLNPTDREQDQEVRRLRRRPRFGGKVRRT